MEDSGYSIAQARRGHHDDFVPGLAECLPLEQVHMANRKARREGLAAHAEELLYNLVVEVPSDRIAAGFVLQLFLQVQLIFLGRVFAVVARFEAGEFSTLTGCGTIYGWSGLIYATPSNVLGCAVLASVVIQSLVESNYLY